MVKCHLLQDFMQGQGFADLDVKADLPANSRPRLLSDRAEPPDRNTLFWVLADQFQLVSTSGASSTLVVVTACANSSPCCSVSDRCLSVGRIDFLQSGAAVPEPGVNSAKWSSEQIH